MTPGSTEDPPASLSLPHNCAYATGRGPSVAAGFGDIRVLQGSHEDAPRDPTTIHTPGTGCLGMNLCIKSQLHTGDKLACVCLSPALSPCWGTPNSCSEWHFPVPSGSICLFGKKELVEALGLHF